MHARTLLSGSTKSKMALAFASLLLAGQAASAGQFTFTTFTGDANSGINSGLTYTAKADFNGDGSRIVNGVPFTDAGLSGSGYALTIATSPFSGFGNNVTGSSGSLLSDFFYTGDNSGNASLTLSGLAIGTQYVTTWYSAGFGPVGGRNIHITPSDTGTPFTFDENFSGAGNGNLLRYTFTATAATMTYSFDADGNGDSFHHYAMTNAVASPLLPIALITRATGPGPQSPFTVRNDDLLQTNLASVTSSGDFAQEGAGGVPILTNGAFTINGGNPADNSQLATGTNGASITFILDTSSNTLGYDVSSIEGYGGWNDGGRDHQLYEVFYSLVGSADFVYLGRVDDEPTSLNGISAVKAVFSTALTGVDAVRIDFLPGQENGYVGYGEFDVVGSPTVVPEPATLSVLAVGALSLVRRRRLAGR